MLPQLAMRGDGIRMNLIKTDAVMEKENYEQPAVRVVEMEPVMLLQSSRDSYGPAHEG
ncbi:MAG: hypothetical protein IKP48_05900 [Bacteroidaceae bacterium]|nr:hypothetical protein [Bacteroidaceae bacterium]